MKKMVWGPDGYGLGPANSKVGKGESIVNFNTGDSTLITKGTVGKDTEYSSVTADDDNVILGNDPNFFRYRGGKDIRTFAQLAAPITAARLLIHNRLGVIDVMLQDRMSKIAKNSQMSSLSKATLQVTQKEFDKIKAGLQQQDQQLEQQHMQLAEEQKAQHMMQAKCGKDAFDGGTDISPWVRMFPSLASTGASLAQLLHWSGQPVVRNNTYAANPYSTLALQELNGLRLSPYNQIKAIQDAERRAVYNMDLKGTTGANRYYGRIALGIGAQQNAANVLAAADQQNNAYRTQYANALLQEGNSIAQRRQQAAQFDRQDYIAAHGRKTKGIETATANLLNSINSAYANEFKYKTWKDTADIYRQQVTNEQANRLAEIKDRAEARRLELQKIDALKAQGNIYLSPYLDNRFLNSSFMNFVNPSLIWSNGNGFRLIQP